MTLDRRSFLLGGAAAAALTACGGGSDDPSAADGSAGAQTSVTAGRAGDQPLQIAQLFSPGPYIAALPQQRVPFALVGPDGPLRGDGDPATVRVVDQSGNESSAIAVPRFVPHAHDEDDGHDHVHVNDLRYYAPRLDFAGPGLHRLIVESTEGSGILEFAVVDRRDVPIAGPGDPFPSFVSPTASNPAGVDTLCTRNPPCELHSASVDSLLAEGRPFVVLVSTPAYCHTQFCGPVLDVLLRTLEEGDVGVTGVHVEVWANPVEVGGDVSDPQIRPAPGVEALGLEFEPVLYVVGAAGIVRARIDNLFDAEELTAALMV